MLSVLHFDCFFQSEEAWEFSQKVTVEKLVLPTQVGQTKIVRVFLTFEHLWLCNIRIFCVFFLIFDRNNFCQLNAHIAGWRKTWALLYFDGLGLGKSQYSQLDKCHFFMYFVVLCSIYEVLASLHSLFSSFWVLYQFQRSLSAKFRCKSPLPKLFLFQENLWHQTKDDVEIKCK